MIAVKGAVLFGSERLIIRSKDTVLTEKLTRCNCVVNAPFAQPMLLQLDQASMSVSVCVCANMDGSLFYTESSVAIRDPYKNVNWGPCEHACYYICCNHMRLQHVYTASPCIAEYTKWAGTM